VVFAYSGDDEDDANAWLLGEIDSVSSDGKLFDVEIWESSGDRCGPYSPQVDEEGDPVLWTAVFREAIHYIIDDMEDGYCLPAEIVAALRDLPKF
jgi:hypothetical protein